MMGGDLRAAIEALMYRDHHDMGGVRFAQWVSVADLRAVLDAHPAAPTVQAFPQDDEVTP